MSEDFYRQYEMSRRSAGVSNPGPFIKEIQKYEKAYSRLIPPMGEAAQEMFLKNADFGGKRYSDLRSNEQSNRRCGLKKYEEWLQEGVVYFSDETKAGYYESYRTVVKNALLSVKEHLQKLGYWEDEFLLPIVCLDGAILPAKRYRYLNREEICSELRDAFEYMDIPDSGGNGDGFDELIAGVYNKKTHTITIYYNVVFPGFDNNPECPENVKRDFESLMAHEMFHAAHYQKCGDRAVWHSKRLTWAQVDMTIFGDIGTEKTQEDVLESLAAYYEYFYCREKGKREPEYNDIARQMLQEWRKRICTDWPYAKALLICFYNKRPVRDDIVALTKHRKIYEKSLVSTGKAWKHLFV